MSRENVEVVRQVIEANRSDDLEACIEAVLARSDPRVEFRSVLAAVEGATYLGHDGIRRYFKDLADSWQEWQNEPEEVFEVGPDTVLAQVRFRAIGQSSGAAVEGRNTVVFALSDGKLLQVHSYPSREAALEAVGLSENVELAHRAYDAFNRRDLDAFLALMDADVQAVPLAAAIEGDYLGHDGIRRWWNNGFDVFPDWTAEVVEVRDLGDLTVAHLRNRGHGTGSDTPFDVAAWLVAEWHDKKVVWWSNHGTEAEALEAVGLRE